MRIEITKRKPGNCRCGWCGRFEGILEPQPFTVYIKPTFDRGHNIPVCSEECANEYMKRWGGSKMTYTLKCEMENITWEELEALCERYGRDPEEIQDYILDSESDGIQVTLEGVEDFLADGTW